MIGEMIQLLRLCFQSFCQTKQALILWTARFRLQQAARWVTCPASQQASANAMMVSVSADPLGLPVGVQYQI